VTIVLVAVVVWLVAAVLFALLIGAFLRRVSHDDAVRDRARAIERDRIKKAG
jgi:uncharacterized membrane protein